MGIQNFGGIRRRALRRTVAASAHRADRPSGRLDAALFKTFWFDRSRLTASLILRNLLGDGNTVYSAYESQRVRRIRSGDTLCYAPHATRLTYAYPRSFYLTISYRF